MVVNKQICQNVVVSGSAVAKTSYGRKSLAYKQVFEYTTIFLLDTIKRCNCILSVNYLATDSMAFGLIL